MKGVRQNQNTKKDDESLTIQARKSPKLIPLSSTYTKSFMRIFRDIQALPKFNNAVITIGSFDGVHIGHQKIIKRLNHLAKEIDGESVIITFDPHPRKIIYPKDNSLQLLTTLEEKIDLCESFGVDNLVIVPFSIEFSQQHPREYVERFLIGSFAPKYIVIGYDHKFGLNRKGDISLLQEYQEEHGFEVVQIKKQELEDITISSTKIRNALLSGDIQDANHFLNHNYKLSGVVGHGDKIGKTIGYPTANIVIDESSKLIPLDGVYAAYCHLEGVQYRGMLYIGNRPTLEDVSKKQKIEVNIFDFDQNIYDKPLEIELIAKTRSDIKFDSLDDLKAQLAQDKVDSLSILERHSNSHAFNDKVCIAILNYNGEEYLESYLPQVLYSSSDPINVAVIDNASTDESVAYLQDWHPEVQIIPLTKNYGFADGYNRGMQNIDAEYTVILNSDVSVATNWLDPIIERMDADPQLSIVQPKIRSLEERDQFEYAGAAGGFIDALGYPYCRGRIFDTVEKDTGQYDSEMEIDWATGAAMVVRTKAFKDLGGFDGSYFAHMEEIDFCIRARRAGHKIKVEPNSIVYHLGGGTLDYGNSRKVFLNFRNSLYTIYKNKSGLSAFSNILSRLILDGVAGAKFLAGGQISSLMAIVKAHWAFFGQLSNLAKKKKHYNKLIRDNRVGPFIPNSSHSKSIVLDYYLRGKKTFNQLKNK